MTKTISLKSLISMYYKTADQKAEVNGYVSKIQANTQKHQPQYTQQNSNSNNSSDSYSSSSSDDDYYSDDGSSSTNTDSDYQDDSSEDYE